MSCLQARLPGRLSSYKAPENPYNQLQVITNPGKCLQQSSKCLVWVSIYSILHCKMQIHRKVASLVMALSISFSFLDRNKINSFTQRISHAMNWKFSSTNCFLFQLHSLVSNTYIYLQAGTNPGMTYICMHTFSVFKGLKNSVSHSQALPLTENLIHRSYGRSYYHFFFLLLVLFISFVFYVREI